MARAALLEDAAAGRLPPWSRAGEQRLAHMRRVADLLGEWAAALNLSAADRIRWRAAGFLHDALREAPPEELRAMLPASLDDLDDRLLHGPAAAARLREDGLDDDKLLLAIAYHTIGHPDFDDLGRALFVADYIEPGRTHEPALLATLRARMPDARDAVLREVLQARIDRLLFTGRPMRPETLAFWNALGDGDADG